jgi:hypothetical protein
MFVLGLFLFMATASFGFLVYCYVWHRAECRKIRQQERKPFDEGHGSGIL